MTTYSKQKLSGGTSGKGVLVAATGTIGTTIHTATNAANEWDEVWIWAVCTHTATVLLTVEFGAAAVPNLIVQYIPTQTGPVLIVPGLILQGGLLVTAFAGTTNVVACQGFVNRISP